MEPILGNYSMEIYASNIRALKESIEGYENEIQQNDAQLKLLLQKKTTLQKGLQDLQDKLKEQERKKEEEESPAGQERRRLAEAKRQYLEVQQQKRDLKVPIQSAEMQRLGLLRRQNSGENKVARLPSSGINKLNSHGPYFASKFNKLMSGFSGEQDAKEKLEKLKTDGGKKHKTRKR